jgi:hypothetical protein
MADKYSGYSSGVSDPARRAVPVTPFDNADLADVPTSIYVGTAGDITMIGVDASSGASGVLWKNVPAGTILPFRPRRILATGTSAANILALY